MGIVATWVTTCDECGKQITKSLLLNDMTVAGGEPHSNGVTTYHGGIWSPGLPEGWLQYAVKAEEIWRPDINRSHYFFDCHACLLKWLRRHGQVEIAKYLEDVILLA